MKPHWRGGREGTGEGVSKGRSLLPNGYKGRGKVACVCVEMKGGKEICLNLNCLDRRV